MPFTSLLLYFSKRYWIPTQIDRLCSNIIENRGNTYIIIKDQLTLVITWIKLKNISNFCRVFQMIQTISLKIRHSSSFSILAYIIYNIKKIFY